MPGPLSIGTRHDNKNNSPSTQSFNNGALVADWSTSVICSMRTHFEVRVIGGLVCCQEHRQLRFRDGHEATMPRVVRRTGLREADIRSPRCTTGAGYGFEAAGLEAVRRADAVVLCSEAVVIQQVLSPRRPELKQLGALRHMRRVEGLGGGRRVPGETRARDSCGVEELALIMAAEEGADRAVPIEPAPGEDLPHRLAQQRGRIAALDGAALVFEEEKYATVAQSVHCAIDSVLPLVPRQPARIGVDRLLPATRRRLSVLPWVADLFEDHEWLAQCVEVLRPHPPYPLQSVVRRVARRRRKEDQVLPPPRVPHELWRPGLCPHEARRVNARHHVQQ